MNYRTTVNLPDIAMEWDGKDKVAKLIVGGFELEGNPEDVQFVFEELNYMRDERNTAQWKVGRIKELLDNLNKEMPA